MSSQCIYVIVWNMRDTNGVKGLEYWLSSIRSKAGDSQVIIVGTHLDQGALVSAEHLRQKYPEIKGFFSVSCVGKGEGVDHLRQSLVDIASNQMLDIPSSYFKLAEAITQVRQF